MRQMPRKNPSQIRINFFKTLLVDGNALYKRSFLGAYDEYNRDGIKIGGLYQFLTVLRKLMQENVYRNVIVFWDGEKSGKLRYDVYPEYKGNRNKDYENGSKPEDADERLQQFKVMEYLEELGIKQFQHNEVEADDLIGYYCLQKDDNEKITIATGDRDICQLIDEDINIYILDKKDYFDVEKFTDEFGYPAANIKTIKVLTGDASDNIKGVAGVATKGLFNEFPELRTETLTVEDIIEKAKVKQEARLSEGKKGLKKYTNIIEGNTKGSQGDRLYEINEMIINLRKPLVPVELRKELDEFFDGYVDMDDRELTKIYEKISRDGLESAIKSSNLVNYLVPFKAYQDRCKLLLK